MGYSVAGDGRTERVRAVRRVLAWVLVLNLGVAIVKLGYGLIIGSVSVTADGFHSMFDGTSNVIGLIGLGIAARPADRGHPYGHSKYETFATAAIGALLLFAAWRVGSSAIERLQDPGAGPRVDAISFVVMIATLIVNLLVTTFERRAGERLGSAILKADASHTASDVLVTIGVMGGLLAVWLGYPIADPIIGLLVAGAIIFTAFRVLASAGVSLSDSARIDPGRICDVVLAIEGVRGCHHIRTRGNESEVYVDLHIQVDAQMTVAEGHAVAEKVEKAVAEGFQDVIDVIAHLEPFDSYQARKTEEQEKNGLL